ARRPMSLDMRRGRSAPLLRPTAVRLSEGQVRFGFANSQPSSPGLTRRSRKCAKSTVFRLPDWIAGLFDLLLLLGGEVGGGDLRVLDKSKDASVLTPRRSDYRDVKSARLVDTLEDRYRPDKSPGGLRMTMTEP